MPIHDAKSKRFVPANVAKAPRKPGVYALYDGSELVFVGCASQRGVTIRGMLRRHLAGLKGPRTAGATHYRRETCATPRARLRQLLDEHVAAHSGLPRFNVV